ncbi:MAG: ice-binding family protein, partial [Candidatus Cloacimonadaceae bacterium]|nr:ice-binding family protein [Candidatus Cloacimonadaceae bacterium]
TPTPTNLNTAIGDMITAYNDAAGRVDPDYLNLGSGDISGLTLAPGLYKWGTGLSINDDVTLTGGPNDVWIFQIAEGISMGSGASITLAGGALPKNIFWQAAGVVALNTTAHMEGIILSQTAITLATGASINGRLLAQTAVTLDQSTVIQPAP